MTTSAPPRPSGRRPNPYDRRSPHGRTPAPRRTPPRVPRRPIPLADHRRRATALLIAALIVLSVFAGRLLELQAVKGEALAAAALGSRLRTQDIPAERGSITDVHGQPLAVTVEARNVTADQTLVLDPAAEAAELAPLLGMDVAAVQERLTGERRFVYVAKQITPQTWRRIADLELPGIFNEKTTRRVYPAGSLAANVVGFVGAEGEGLGGIEFGMEDLLRGVDGSLTYERGGGGSAIPTSEQSRVEPVPGTTVRLTLDRDIQWVAQQAITEAVRGAKADSGTVVVMEPSTGRLLALATAPTFDANDPGAAPASDRGNRALSEVYEPGSTSKVMTIAAVVDQKKADPYTAITVPPSLPRGGKDFHDHTPHGTLNLTLAGVMAKSSNIGTILAAERIGGDTLYEYLKKFGIGESTGLGFPGESSGYVPPPKDWSGTSFPTIAFGQGLSVNSVQAASVFATIANDGVRVPPRLVDSYELPDGTVEQPETGEPVPVVSRKAATQVRKMLEMVVSDQGTAPMAAIPGYRVGGKTGTAQYVDPECGCYRGVVASFIGMAPADKPELIVAVSIVKPRVGRYGGQLGGPVFQRVMTYALQVQRVPPTGSKPPSLPVDLGGAG
ncbi:MAG: penicillin-binding protein 2 [Candidatus Nanopelagicales bacterium]